eukprot:gene7107-9696_t
MDNKIKVGIRYRPLSNQERETGAEVIVRGDLSNSRIFLSDNNKNQSIKNQNQTKQTFDFDWIFREDSSQRLVYESMCKPLVQNIFDGFNGTFFAYGQTGSGKTHTMGTSLDNDGGVLPFALDDVFKKKLEITEQGATVKIELSYLEIYMEGCYDLLSKDRKELNLRELSSGETILEDLTTYPVQDVESVYKYIKEATKNRATGQTAMNAQSSRSHAICTLTLHVLSPNGTAVKAKLHLVDLAGSERQKKTQATGEQFQEGISINKGLLALGNVVSALSLKSESSNCQNNGQQHIHIPYRESKLTRLLKDALGGNGMTAMLACVSPADSNYEETLSTLRFASRASSIINKVKVNHDDSSLNDAAALIKEVKSLREQLDLANAKYSAAMEQVIIHSSSSGYNSSSVNEIVILNASIKLVQSLKSILVTCLEEGAFIEDEQLEFIQSDMADIRATIRASFGIECKNTAINSSIQDPSGLFSDIDIALDFLPPIMGLIDEIKSLEQELQELCDVYYPQLKQIDSESGQSIIQELSISRNTTEQNNNANELSYQNNKQLNSSETVDSEVIQEGNNSSSLIPYNKTKEESEAIRNVLRKEAEMKSMTRLADEYQNSIKCLHAEIQSLEKEKQSLQGKENNHIHHNKSSSDSSRPLKPISINIMKSRPQFNSNNSNDIIDEKTKKELKEKSKLLEEKMKLLRAKEAEFSRIVIQKDNLNKEVTDMRIVVVEYKKKRVEMQKQLREEVSIHRKEKAKLITIEQQSKKREQLAHQSLQRLEEKLINKEKVWKGHLLAKEQESIKLKELINKQQTVKNMNEHNPNNNSNKITHSSSNTNTKDNNYNNSNNNNNNNNISIERQAELRVWVEKEVEDQCKKTRANEELSKEMALRSRATKEVQELRIQKKNNHDNIIGMNNNNNIDRRIKSLEEEMRKRTINIANLQNEIGLRGINSMNPNNNNANNNDNKKRFTRINDQKESKILVETLFDLSVRHYVKERQFEEKINRMSEMIKKQQIELNNLRPPTAHVNNNKRGGDGSDYDDDSHDEMDETFYPSEEEVISDDDDLIKRESSGSRNKNKTNNKNNKNNNNRNNKKVQRDSSDDVMIESEDESDDSVSIKRKKSSKKRHLVVENIDDDNNNDALVTQKRKRGKKVKSQINDEFVPIEDDLSQPYSQYTVKELKVYLANRGLAVSGVKDELIRRLESYHSSTVTSQPEQVTNTTTSSDLSTSTINHIIDDSIDSKNESSLLSNDSFSDSDQITTQPFQPEPDVIKRRKLVSNNTNVNIMSMPYSIENYE